MRKFILAVVIVLLLAVIAFCAYKILPAFIQYGEYDGIHSEIVNEMESILDKTEEDTSNIVVWQRETQAYTAPPEIPTEPQSEEATTVIEVTREPEEETTAPEESTTAEEITSAEEVTSAAEEMTSAVTEAETEPPIEYKVGSISTAQFNSIKATLHSLKEKYPDIYGYIYVVIPTYNDPYIISYPVVRGEDNAYYLDHAYDGTKIFSGAIFADFTLEDKVSDNKNLVIYGHNMNSGEMFMPLTKLKFSNSFYGAECYFFTEDAVYVYDLFAFYNTSETDNYVKVRFRDSKDFVNFCENLQKKSMYNKKYVFNENDRIITLSTCNNSLSGGRYAVHGILIQITK